MELEQSKLRVVVIGGSLGGLMCGLALKHSGHSVTVLEKEGDIRQSHQTGITLGPDIREFLKRHDRHSEPFSIPSYVVQALRADSEDTPRLLVKARRDSTSWDALYFRLRSCFDDYVSPHYPSPPPSCSTDGAATFLTHEEVVDLTQSGPDRLDLTVFNRDSREISHREFDLAIGADGPNSFVRTKYLPAIQPRYVGYVAWRVTIPEKHLSASMRRTFANSLTICASHRQYCMIYVIPGREGTLEPGERLLNFAWYTNESPQRLDEIMTDSIDGHRHATTVPAGHVRDDIWKAQVELGKKARLPRACLEILEKVQSPFVQAITEFAAPTTMFEGGKVLLIGDAKCVFRPHLGAGASQAAFDALRAEDFVGGRVTLQKWEQQVLRYSRLQSSQAAWWGEWYLSDWITAAPYALRYWFLCNIEMARSWLDNWRS
ncbi:hypothetical protein F5B19DRAFT_260490 [Rostrohypoxylon terebratum]|nr:hypothetical protein F5B19DRAFT_260490 [Rostrohypoxylon terebratum]